MHASVESERVLKRRKSIYARQLPAAAVSAATFLAAAGGVQTTLDAAIAATAGQGTKEIDVDADDDESIDLTSDEGAESATPFATTAAAAADPVGLQQTSELTFAASHAKSFDSESDIQVQVRA